MVLVVLMFASWLMFNFLPSKQGFVGGMPRCNGRHAYNDDMFNSWSLRMSFCQPFVCVGPYPLFGAWSCLVERKKYGRCLKLPLWPTKKAGFVALGCAKSMAPRCTWYSSGDNKHKNEVEDAPKDARSKIFFRRAGSVGTLMDWMC